MAPAELLYVEASTPALIGDDQAAGAHGLGAARDGPQVAGVGEVIEDDDERPTAVLVGVGCGRALDFGNVHIDVGLRLRHNALVATAIRHLVE